MNYHVHISELVVYPGSYAEPSGPEVRCLYATINGVPIPVAIPPDIPLTRPAIRAYLLTQQDQIIIAYNLNKALEPIHNYDIGMDFDWEVP